MTTTLTRTLAAPWTDEDQQRLNQFLNEDTMWKKTADGYESRCGRARILRLVLTRRNRRPGRRVASHKQVVRWDARLDGVRVPVHGTLLRDAQREVEKLLRQKG